MAKSTICTRIYLDAEGREFKNLPADPSAIVSQLFRFSNGEIREVILSEFGDAVRHGAALHGLNQAFGDSFAGSKGDADTAVESFDARYDTIFGNQWTSRTGGGSKLDSMLVEAVMAVYAENKIDKEVAKVRAYFLCEGLDGTDEEVKAERKLRRAKWMKRADVTEHYTRIKAERDAKKVTLDAESEEAQDMLDDIDD